MYIYLNMHKSIARFTPVLLIMVSLRDYWKAFLLKYLPRGILTTQKSTSNFVNILPKILKRKFEVTNKSKSFNHYSLHPILLHSL